MITYQDHGSFVVGNGKSIPKDHRFYREVLQQVASGTAEIVVYVAPPRPIEERRQEEYQKRGASIEALIVALWEKVVENRPNEANRIQAIREQVKQEIPKP